MGNNQAASYSLSHACILGSCADGGLRPLQAAGCLAVKGVPLSNRSVRLTQPDEAPRTRRTDVRGCFQFDVVQGKPFDVEIVGPDVPE